MPRPLPRQAEAAQASKSVVGPGAAFCHTRETRVESMPTPLPQHPLASLLKPLMGTWVCPTFSSARRRQQRLRKVPRGRETAFCHIREA